MYLVACMTINFKFTPCIQRIAKCTREGGPSSIQLERYTEALLDDSACMTYPALVGQRKQSVQDAERMFSEDLEKFMRRKGYNEEAQYIKAVRGWRRACDERGLSELERSRLNYGLLNYILDDLMPWHSTDYDFSLLEVTRYVLSKMALILCIVYEYYAVCSKYLYMY